MQACDRTAGNALGGRIGRDEVWMLALEGLELLHQRIERIVGDFRIVVNVVALFVMPDLIAELLDAGGGVH